MTQRLVARSIVALALVVPIGAGAQADGMTATYEASGLVVEMSVGTFTGTDTGAPFRLKSQDTFKTLHLAFATNGTLTDVRVSKN